jgi:hypothetical protein
MIPTPHLEKQLPYVYKCSCNTNKPPSPLSHSSLNVNNDTPCKFNGAMFGQVFPSPTLKPSQVPIIVYLPTSTHDFWVHHPWLLFKMILRYPPSSLQCSNIDSMALPYCFMGTLFGQDFYSAVTTATTPKPVAHPPPPDAIAIILWYSIRSRTDYGGENSCFLLYTMLNSMKKKGQEMLGKWWETKRKVVHCQKPAEQLTSLSLLKVGGARRRCTEELVQKNQGFSTICK